jgi:phosphatidylinositol glycan class B
MTGIRADVWARLHRQAPLIVLLAVAAIVRVVATEQTANSFLYPDELFQYLEQAHRHVFGYGVVPWEYRLGLRSWLYPLLLTVPMRLGDMLDPDGSLYLLLPRTLAALSSLAIIWAAYALGRRLSVVHAIVAAFVAAIWFEFILYAAHSLTESLSFSAFMIAAVLASDARRSTPLLVGAGLAFGLAAILRFQHIPAIAAFVLASRLPWRLWLPIIAGAAIAAAASAAVDLYAGQAPFGWLIANIGSNFLAGKADQFGTSSLLAYLGETMHRWGLWLLPILLLAVRGARFDRPLMWAALANLAFHMAIPHKEYRFIFLTISIVVILAALGTGDMLIAMRKRWPTIRLPILAGAAMSIWLVASVMQAMSPVVVGDWKAYSPLPQALATTRRTEKLCGVVVYRAGFWTGASYAMLHRKVPMYLVAPPDMKGIDADPPAGLRAMASAANIIIAQPGDRGDVDPRYHATSCHQSRSTDSATVCVFVRSGACVAADPNQQAHEVNAVLRRTGW